jgi:hypothetical protein
MSKIVLHMEGGLVQWAYTLQNEKWPGKEPTGVIIVDFSDVEDAEEEDLTEIVNDQEEVVDAVIHEEELNNLPKGCDIDLLIEAYEEKKLIESYPVKNLPLLMGQIKHESSKKLLAQRIKGGE